MLSKFHTMFIEEINKFTYCCGMCGTVTVIFYQYNYYETFRNYSHSIQSIIRISEFNIYAQKYIIVSEIDVA